MVAVETTIVVAAHHQVQPVEADLHRRPRPRIDTVITRVDVVVVAIREIVRETDHETSRGIDHAIVRGRVANALDRDLDQEKRSIDEGQSSSTISKFYFWDLILNCVLFCRRKSEDDDHKSSKSHKRSKKSRKEKDSTEKETSGENREASDVKQEPKVEVKSEKQD